MEPMMNMMNMIIDARDTHVKIKKIFSLEESCDLLEYWGDGAGRETFTSKIKVHCMVHPFKVRSNLISIQCKLVLAASSSQTGTCTRVDVSSSGIGGRGVLTFVHGVLHA